MFVFALLRRAATYAVLIAIIACGGDPAAPPAPEEPPAIAIISLTPDAVNLSVGESRQMAALIRSASGTVLGGRVLLWQSSDTSVMQVDTQGRITARRAGLARVLASAEGRQGMATVGVMILPDSSMQRRTAAVDTTVFRSIRSIVSGFGISTVSSAGQSDLVIPRSDPRLFIGLDSANNVRGLAVSSPENGTVIVDARSTAVALAMLTAGVLTPDSVALRENFRIVQTLPCIDRLSGALRQSLAGRPLLSALEDPSIIAARDSCSQQAVQATAPPAVSAISSTDRILHEGRAYGFKVRVIDADGDSRFEYENDAFARANLYVQDASTSGTTTPDLLVEYMRGTTPLSIGSFLTFTANKPTVVVDREPFTNPTPTRRVWIVGAGLRSPQESVPAGLDQVRSELLGGTIWDYAFAGLTRLVGLYAPDQLQPFFKQAATAAGAVRFLNVAPEPRAVTRASIDFGVSAFIVANSAYCATLTVANATAIPSCAAVLVLGTVSALAAGLNLGSVAVQLSATPRAFSIAVPNAIGPSVVSRTTPAALVGPPGVALPFELEVRNSVGKVIPSARLQLSVLTGGGTVTPAQPQTDAAGRVRVTWRLGSALGAQTMRAAILNGPLGGTTISATAVAPASASRSTLTVGASSLPIGGATSLTVTLRNAAGQGISPATPGAFVATTSSGTLSAWTCSGSSCTSTFSASAISGNATIQVMIEGQQISGSPASIAVQSVSGPFEPNNSPATATPIAPSERQTHTLPVGDVDWLQLQTTTVSAVRLQLNGTSAENHVHTFAIFDETGSRVLTSVSGRASTGLTLTLANAPPRARVQVCADRLDNFCGRGFGNLDIGTYTITFTLLSGAVRDTPVSLLTDSLHSHAHISNERAGYRPP